MSGSELAFAIFDRCLTTLGLICEGKKQRDEKTDQALFALYAALNETKSYAETLRHGKRRNRRRERQIANLWVDASIPLRHIDSVLAGRCFEKGNYWMDPHLWTEGRIKRKGIALDQMLKRTREILLRK